jgi:hypothetical protein
MAVLGFELRVSGFGEISRVAQKVQVVRAVPSPTSFLPRVAGEDEGRGLKESKHLEQLEPNLRFAAGFSLLKSTKGKG